MLSELGLKPNNEGNHQTLRKSEGNVRETEHILRNKLQLGKEPKRSTQANSRHINPHRQASERTCGNHYAMTGEQVKSEIKKISYALNDLREQVAKLMKEEQMYLAKDKIITAVEIASGVNYKEMRSKTREHHVVHARMIFTVIYRRNGGTFAQCGKVFNRDHSTAIHWAKNHPNFMYYDDYKSVYCDAMNILTVKEDLLS
jgi:hypothetical protein